MSEIKRFDIPRDGNEFMHEDPDGEYVLYDDHLAEMFRMRAEVERLTVERDKAQAGDDVALSALTSALRERDAAQAEVERLTQELEGRRATNQRVIAERDAALNEVGRLRGEVGCITSALSHKVEQCRALTLAVEQADELKAHAEASAAAEEAETDRVTAERDAAQAEVEQLKAERDESDWKLGIRRKDSSDQFRTVLTLRAERDAARAEIERLRANGQVMLDTSRPTDETIWWKAFNSFLRDHSLTIEEVADQAQAALTIYRARWPR